MQKKSQSELVKERFDINTARAHRVGLLSAIASTGGSVVLLHIAGFPLWWSLAFGAVSYGLVGLVEVLLHESDEEKIITDEMVKPPMVLPRRDLVVRVEDKGGSGRIKERKIGERLD